MRVENFMSKEIWTLHKEQTIKEAMTICNDNKIRHLPIVENDELIGILSDRDIKNALPSTLFDDLKREEIMQTEVAKIMKMDVITAHPSDFIEEAAFTMYASHVGCLPIVQQEKLVGMLTESDILYALVKLMGVAEPSSVIKVEVDDLPGQLADVSLLIKECTVNITNVMVYPSKRPGKKLLSFRLKTIDTRAVIQLLKANGYTIVWPDIDLGGTP